MFLEKKIVSKKNRAKPPVLGEEGWQAEHWAGSVGTGLLPG